MKGGDERPTMAFWPQAPQQKPVSSQSSVQERLSVIPLVVLAPVGMAGTFGSVPMARGEGVFDSFLNEGFPGARNPYGNLRKKHDASSHGTSSGVVAGKLGGEGHALVVVVIHTVSITCRRPPRDNSPPPLQIIPQLPFPRVSPSLQSLSDIPGDSCAAASRGTTFPAR